MPKHKLLTLPEELNLAMRIEAGREAEGRIKAGEDDPHLVEIAEDGRQARDVLVACNQGLVHRVALSFTSHDRATSYDDLVQEGNCGLLEAINKFDWRRGQRFSTLATWWVRQAISRLVRTSGTIRVPDGMQYRKNTKLQQMAMEARRVYELDAPLTNRKQEESSNTLADIIPGHHDTEREALDRIMVEWLLAQLSTEAQRDALRLWMQGYSRYEVGDLLGKSRGMVYVAEETLRARVGRTTEELLLEAEESA